MDIKSIMERSVADRQFGNGLRIAAELAEKSYRDPLLKEVLMLGRDNVIIKNHISMVESGQRNLDDALKMMIVALAKSEKNYMDALKDALAKSGS